MPAFDLAQGQGALEISHGGGPLTIALRASDTGARVTAVVLSRPSR